jgi:hypothetical protein
MIPCTVYPFASSSAARYEPSCPVIPVMSATFKAMSLLLNANAQRRGCGCKYGERLITGKRSQTGSMKNRHHRHHRIPGRSGAGGAIMLARGLR